jgi:hypothetical protein
MPSTTDASLRTGGGEVLVAAAGRPRWPHGETAFARTTRRWGRKVSGNYLYGRAVRTSAAVCLLSGLPMGLAAQAAPFLDGRVVIDLDEGGLAGDVCLAAVQVRGDSVTLVLNRGLTIKRISGVRSPAASMELEPGGAAVRYTFLGAIARAAAPAGTVADVCVEYTGRFPVYDVAMGDYRDEDASSVIAFNGSTVRARGVSRWHPAPFDPHTGLAVEAMAYRLEVECSRCASIYLNGSGPSAGPIAAFESEHARELFLLAGELSNERIGGLTFIGRPVPPDSAERFATHLEAISAFLEEFVGVAYGAPPEVVTATAVRAPRRGQLWGFFSDPALVLIGMSVPELLQALEREDSPSRRSVVGFLAHELGHRYFGWRFGGATAQRDLFGEPFATYLELKAVRHFFGEVEYAASVERLRRQGSRAGPQPTLNVADAEDFARSSYRYGYSPLMLLSLEEAIGEATMRSMLSAMLAASPAAQVVADYTFLAETARSVGVPDPVWSSWEQRCVVAPSFVDECLTRAER